MTIPVFTGPEWAKAHWDIRSCTIIKVKNGDYAVLDHSIQTIVAEGTRDECRAFLVYYGD